ncbi:hypothetical protein BJX99DRAFT_224423 [Aspergillus californicus]
MINSETEQEPAQTHPPVVSLEDLFQIPSVVPGRTHNQAMPTWRTLNASDIEGLMHVADEVHPSLPESAHVFAERVRLYPEGCLALEEDGEICGYAISYPIRQHQPPALDSLLGEIASDADQYYIHDIAISPRLRGGGLAAECIGKLLVTANRYQKTCLVSVYGTEAFWARFGFVPEPVTGAMRSKLCDYGEDAIYLSRSNDQMCAMLANGSG